MSVVVITGCSSGIGLEAALAFARNGDTVYATMRDVSRGTKLQTTADAEGLDIQIAALDLIRADDFPEIIGGISDASGHIDVLVNNAGINIPCAALDVTEEDWDAILDVNLKGVFFTAQRVARVMKESGGGKIVNIASQNGFVAYYKRAAYCASKAGVVNLTRVLAVEWAEHKINVNAVGPTFILTPLTQATFDDPEQRADLISRIPAGRVGQPEDVTGAVVFLASQAASMITGHTLLVDGGWTAL